MTCSVQCQLIHHTVHIDYTGISGVPRIFVWGGGSTNLVEGRGQRERGPGSGGNCNLVQEISFHVVKFS